MKKLIFIASLLLLLLNSGNCAYAKAQITTDCDQLSKSSNVWSPKFSSQLSETYRIDLADPNVEEEIHSSNDLKSNSSVKTATTRTSIYPHRLLLFLTSEVRLRFYNFSPPVYGKSSPIYIFNRVLRI